MPLLSQFQRANALAAEQRAQLWPAAEGMQLGEVSGSTITWGTAFAAAFTRLATGVEIVAHGKIRIATAKVHVRKSLGLTFTEASLFRDVASGDTYNVLRIGPDNEGMAEIPVFLQRRED